MNPYYVKWAYSRGDITQNKFCPLLHVVLYAYSPNNPILYVVLRDGRFTTEPLAVAVRIMRVFRILRFLKARPRSLWLGGRASSFDSAPTLV